MTLLVIAFLSGVLTVLAPCVLPLLPIVLWASAEDGDNKKIPLVIIGSLSVSIILFSLILKASTVLIGVPPSFWKSFSWGMIIALGIITIFPNLWKSVTSKFKLSDNSNKLLSKSHEKKGMMKYVFMGFALGPVFSSCSPTYALILAIVLPAGFWFWFLALISYTLGLAAILLAIAVFGQKLIKNLKWASDPKGTFKKVLWFIFILVGLAIISGYDKKIEAAVLDAGFLNTTIFEQNIINELDLDSLDDSSAEKKTPII
jgi:cytochrome c-type biogenesis protein